MKIYNQDEWGEEQDPDIAKQLDWVDSNPVQDKDFDNPNEFESQFKKLKHKKQNSNKHLPDVEVDWKIDLHGDTIEEAEFHIYEAFDLCIKSNYTRLRIIHGGSVDRIAPIQRRLLSLLNGELKVHIKNWKYDENNTGSTVIYLQSKS